MEFHLPHGPIRSLKEFSVHLGIITLGILIALALEQWVAARHRTHLGAEAVAGFRRELAADRHDVEEVMAAMPGLRSAVQAQIEQLASVPVATAATAPIHYPNIVFDLMSSASWDTAVATQALNEIPYQKARAYGEAYGVFKLFQDEERAEFAAWQELRSFGDDASKLTPEQRRTLIERLRRYEAFTYVVDMVGKSALQTCDRALQ